MLMLGTAAFACMSMLLAAAVKDANDSWPSASQQYRCGALVVVEPEALLELALIVLEFPAELPELRQPNQPGLGGEIGEPVLVPRSM